jgi:hypothetical protein
MITLLLYAIGLVIIDYLIQYKAPIDQPLKNVARIVVIILAIVLIIRYLLGIPIPLR